MTKHRIRHENAFRAGAREGVRDFLTDLLALTPPATHGDLKRLAANVIARPKFQRIDHRAARPGSVEHQGKMHGTGC